MGRYRQEVERGGAFLDKRRPGWREVVNLGRLDLQRCSRCVLGQLAGVEFEVEWEVLLYQFGLSEDTSDAFDFGFNVWATDGSAWEDLTEEWREYIAETRAVAR